MIDNKLHEFSQWDFELLEMEMEELSDFDLEGYGFDEIDSDISDMFDDELIDKHEEEKNSKLKIVCFPEDKVAYDELVQWLEAHEIEYKV